MPFHPIPPIYYSKNYEEEIRKIKMEIELLKEKIKELDKKNNYKLGMEVLY